MKFGGEEWPTDKVIDEIKNNVKNIIQIQSVISL